MPADEAARMAALPLTSVAGATDNSWDGMTEAAGTAALPAASAPAMITQVAGSGRRRLDGVRTVATVSSRAGVGRAEVRGTRDALCLSRWRTHPSVVTAEVADMQGLGLFKNPRALFDVLKETYREWSEDKATRLAAALAYYTAFSIAPLLLICISVAGLVFGREAAQGQVYAQLQGLLGPDAAETIQASIANSQDTGASTLSAIIGLAMLVWSASGVFSQLQDALNTIWEVAPDPNAGMRRHDQAALPVDDDGARDRLPAAGLAGAERRRLGGRQPARAASCRAARSSGRRSTSCSGSRSSRLLFAAIYKVLPDARSSGATSGSAASVTSFLFTVGKILIGLYLGQRRVGSTFGAAGSLLVFLVWVYYSAQILFFGAEFTQVYARPLRLAHQAGRGRRRRDRGDACRTGHAAPGDARAGVGREGRAGAGGGDGRLERPRERDGRPDAHERALDKRARRRTATPRTGTPTAPPTPTPATARTRTGRTAASARAAAAARRARRTPSRRLMWAGLVAGTMAGGTMVARRASAEIWRGSSTRIRRRRTCRHTGTAAQRSPRSHASSRIGYRTAVGHRLEAFVAEERLLVVFGAPAGFRRIAGDERLARLARAHPRVTVEIAAGRGAVRRAAARGGRRVRLRRVRRAARAGAAAGRAPALGPLAAGRGRPPADAGGDRRRARHADLQQGADGAADGRAHRAC